MRLQLLAVAREAKRDPLANVADDYLTRARGLAPPLGLKGPDSRFIAPSKGSDPSAEAERLRAVVPERAVLLDERGAMMTSDELAQRIAKQRDQGIKDLAFCIGGADGFHPDFRQKV